MDANTVPVHCPRTLHQLWDEYIQGLETTKLQRILQGWREADTSLPVVIEELCGM